MHILITRPQPDASIWRTQLEALGVTVSVDPLLTVELLPPQTLPLDGIQALIATSRNGLRALRESPLLSQAIRLPLYAVGSGTADLGRELGFIQIHAGPASARDLVPLLTETLNAADGQLLHLTGDKLAFDLATALRPFGILINRVIVYWSRPALAFQPQTIKAFASGAFDTVALTSPLSAQTFVALCKKSLILEHYQRLVYVCLSQNIAETVQPLYPKAIRVAAQPNTQAMFTLMEAIAHTFV